MTAYLSSISLPEAVTTPAWAVARTITDPRVAVPLLIIGTVAATLVVQSRWTSHVAAPLPTASGADASEVKRLAEQVSQLMREKQGLQLDLDEVRKERKGLVQRWDDERRNLEAANAESRVALRTAEGVIAAHGGVVEELQQARLQLEAQLREQTQLTEGALRARDQQAERTSELQDALKVFQAAREENIRSHYGRH